MGCRTTNRNKMNWIEQLALVQASLASIDESEVTDEVFAMDNIDKMEEGAMRVYDEVDLRVEHVFSPGLYTRILFIPKNVFATSKIHKTTHPFVVMEGRLLVYNSLNAKKHAEDLSGPYFGITKPNTRRAVLALENTVLITFHSTEKTSVEEIEKDIIRPYTNHRLRKGIKS